MASDGGAGSQEDIARELTEAAVRRYGAEAALSLESQIKDTAAWIARVGEVPLEIWSDEPDFLVAARHEEG